jgi:cycloeucalenol cycloisomerase
MELNSNVPYYTYPNAYRMLTIGSVFYGIYFYVSFPMFFRVGETKNWTWTHALIDSLAACMIVTIFLDLWRLVLGHGTGLPWLEVLAK